MRKFIKNILGIFVNSNQNDFVKSITIIQSEISLKSKLNRYSFILNSSIDSYSYLAGFNTIMNTKIGKFCSIAENVKIGLGVHPVSKFVSTSPVFYSTSLQCGISFADKDYFKETGSVIIGNDVWIGVNAVVLDNVKIGNGAIVAAGAIVSNDVPAYAIVGGVPAKILKYRFPEDEIDKLIASKWWEMDEDLIKDNFRKFHDVSIFLEFIREMK